MSILNNKYTQKPIIRHFALIIWILIAIPCTPFTDISIQEIFKEFGKYFFKWKVVTP